ncbi:hypothetical protein BH10CYA1_BH10CYA1_56900 [soil metagenome]
MSFDSNLAKHKDMETPNPAGTDNLANARMENVQSGQNAGQSSTTQNGDQTAHQFLPQGRITAAGIDFGSPFPMNGPGDTPSTPSDNQNPGPRADNTDDNRNDQPGTPPDVKGVPSAEGAVNSSDINQGTVGDCFFEASLASLANTQKGQESIKNMVKTNDDGSLTVTFPGDTSHPITVTQDEIAKLTKEGKLQDKSPTTSAIEAAFQKYDRIGEYGTGINSNDSDDQFNPTFAQISNAGAALHLLTGEGTATEVNGAINQNLNLGGASPENVARFMQQALTNGEPLVAGTSTRGENPIESHHVYSVMGFDPASGLVTVRNPWGNNDGMGVDNVGDMKNGVTNAGDGKLTMSFDTFLKNFNDISAAGVNPTEMRMNDTAHDIGNTAGSIGDTASDIFHGNFGDILPDTANIFTNSLQTVSDGLANTVNEAESIMGARIRGVYDVISNSLHGNLSSLTDVNNAIGVTQPILDAAGTVVNAVADTASSVANSVSSTVSEVWDDLF